MKRWMFLLLGVLLLLPGCARQQAGEPRFTLAQKAAYTFSDGVTVDLWRKEPWDDAFYRLADGTDLLWVRQPQGPENVFSGTGNFQDLPEAAQEAILAYYEAQGLLYDEEAELERAYARYLSCKDSGESFQEGHVEQSVSLSASNDRIIRFTTRLSLPLEVPGEQSSTELQAVFDRATGAEVPVWELFTVPEEEARNYLMELIRPTDAERSEESLALIRAALRPEYISVDAGHLSIWFPKGTLPEGELDGWVFYYEDYPGLLEILRSWALPDSPEQA